jgi:hypothetical protein
MIRSGRQRRLALLVLALSVPLAAPAQERTGAVRVQVAPDHDDWTYRPGAPVVSGPVLSGAAPGGRLTKTVAALLDEIKAERAGSEGRAKALVFDATGIADSTELVELQRFFYPAVGRLARSGRVVVLGTPPADDPAATAQRALEGFTLAGQGGRRPG